MFVVLYTCMYLGLYVCMYTHARAHTYTSGPFFILEITGTTAYHLVSEGYVIVQ